MGGYGDGQVETPVQSRIQGIFAASPHRQFGHNMPRNTKLQAFRPGHDDVDPFLHLVNVDIIPFIKSLPACFKNVQEQALQAYLRQARPKTLTDSYASTFALTFLHFTMLVRVISLREPACGLREASTWMGESMCSWVCCLLLCGCGRGCVLAYFL